MKLTYHEGKNFGDALNPLIFNYFLGEDFFDDDESVQFLGIGSILGLKKKPGKKIVFSSGFADGDRDTYGDLPELSKDYQIICVRGPKTASLLKLDEKLAIADGAILLPLFYSLNKPEKKFKYSLILHHKSMDFYAGWKDLALACGINFIDMRADIGSIVEDIKSSEIVFSEAMHGAIVADAYRVPWVAVNFYPHINYFKWEDWCSSLGMIYKPNNTDIYLHDIDFYNKIISKRFYLPFFMCTPISFLLLFIRKKRIKNFLQRIKTKEGNLSNYELFKSKQDLLLKKLLEFKKNEDSYS
jgi:succinoglycan biosynthesis protein ExoV